ncbi:CRISPR-associated endonuclease Cas3'' [Azospirillum isscasi]|uniref:CRISPR-associated endonuclease Cas3 n=1 Tax=Azospirillum isscasi TaxID=3053926 RepID=A0ABU0WNQ7_9PROT|nr:CRISPR-associated endonuclease Cas3'' [Azospirillum isscasi]MDQ2105608.1 CRISPR-associated endonuclease Cas3'' [Azospirillum isscasi]
MDWYAHTLPNRAKADWEPLRKHLELVAQTAHGFGAHLIADGSAAAFARTLGLLHDAGKYAQAFQDYLSTLKGKRRRVDHSSAGAVYALERYKDHAGWMLAYAVAGHHAGLPDGGGGETGSLRHRIMASPSAAAARAGFMAEIAPLLPDRLPPVTLRDGFQASLFVRMLFSCLTDADALATEGFSDPETAAERGHAPDLDTLGAALDLYLTGKMEAAKAQGDSSVNRIREEVLEHCRAAAAKPPGVFSLAVPTGGGKTLSSLAFALSHVRHHRERGLRRVIYVIPYLSIIEQTAQEFRDRVFGGLPGAVVEHHCAYRPPQDENGKDAEEGNGSDRHKLAAENWDAPVIVTTAVQFFESFFAGRPSRCRKLHNVAGSVIVLDEAQLLPVPHLRPCLAVLRELVECYGCTVLLCTATQPALGKDQPLDFGLPDITPIVQKPERLHKAMRRVRVEHVGPLDDAALVGHLSEAPQALCVVDTRPHAADLFRLLKQSGVEGVRHLSAAMCAEHRSAVLDAIREDLKHKRPCRVVSTQLVEAGVDVSFPLVMRAMAGLDSVAQSAGRCNRNGELGEGARGAVLVFDTDRALKLADLNRRRDKAREVLYDRDWDEALDPAVLESYFRALYAAGGKGRNSDGSDPFDVCGAWAAFGRAGRIEALPFREVSERFRVIDDDQLAVITPYTEAACGWAAALRMAERPAALARKLQRHTVSLPRSRALRLLAAGTVQAVGPDKQFLVLADKGAYDDELGLTARDPRDRSEDENIL